MHRLIAVLVLTISQFTALPFVAIVAANMARQSDAHRVENSNVTVVYKSVDKLAFETL